MNFEGAVIKEKGVTFGIVIVKSHVLNSPWERTDAAQFGVSAFGRMPIVLMSQDRRGVPTYWGRRDIVAFRGVATRTRRARNGAREQLRRFPAIDWW